MRNPTNDPAERAERYFSTAHDNIDDTLQSAEQACNSAKDSQNAAEAAMATANNVQAALNDLRGALEAAKETPTNIEDPVVIISGSLHAGFVVTGPYNRQEARTQAHPSSSVLTLNAPPNNPE